MKQLLLITGFLGSGKTTFLSNALSQSEKKVGVLMNEFGNISIDTSTIASKDMELIELTNGSIFCSCLKTQFIDGVINLLKTDIDILFVESSGLADPSDMGKIIEIIAKKEPELKFDYLGTVCMVDGLYFEKAFDKMLSVQRQIKHSHKIIINKMDLIDSDTYQRILNIIKKENSKAHIISTSYSKIEWADIIPTYFSIEDEVTTNTVSTRTKSVVITFDDNAIIDKEKLELLFKDVSEYYYRAKGYIKINGEILKVDAVNSTVDFLPIENGEKSLENIIINKLVFLSSRSLSSVRELTNAAEKYLINGYTINM